MNNGLKRLAQLTRHFVHAIRPRAPERRSFCRYRVTRNRNSFAFRRELLRSIIRSLYSDA